MSEEYQTQSGSDDSDMETEATEAAEKGNEQEEREMRLEEGGRASSEDSGEEQKKASAGGKAVITREHFDWPRQEAPPHTGPTKDCDKTPWNTCWTGCP